MTKDKSKRCPWCDTAISNFAKLKPNKKYRCSNCKNNYITVRKPRYIFHQS